MKIPFPFCMITINYNVYVSKCSFFVFFFCHATAEEDEDGEEEAAEEEEEDRSFEEGGAGVPVPSFVRPFVRSWSRSLLL